MKPTTLTVFELFEKERRYTVPLFQRPYVWERQWSYLWSDISTRAMAILQTQVDAHALRRHFLGAVVLNHMKVYGKQVAAVEVIDGQQRLTTLQILLAALRDFLDAAGEDSYDSTLVRVTENTCRMENETERFKVWPTNADREVFEKVLTAGSRDEVKRRFPRTRRKWARKDDPRPKLVDAYLYFYGVIAEFLTPHESGAEDLDPTESAPDVDPQATDGASIDRARIDALMEAISNHLELVVIELEERDDPQAIFESLNGLGEPLLPSDLIRNFVFQRATAERLDVDDLYHSRWSSYDSDKFWQAEERQGRLKRKRFDLFIFHYLVSKTERDLGIAQLYQDFKDWWLSEHRGVDYELAELGKYSSLFRSFVEPSLADPGARFLGRLRAIDTTTVYPVLLSTLNAHQRQMNGDVQGIMVSIESYLVRRLVCGLTPKNYNRVFLGLLKAFHRDGHSLDVVRAYLTGLEGDSVRWPNDDEFQKAWLTTPVYTSLGSVKTRMLLEAIEAGLRSKFQEDITINGALTVEHVLPQAWETSGAWPLSDSAAPEHRAAARAIRSGLLHSIGNLTLLTSYLNPSVSNGAFSDKRPKIAAQSAMRLNVFFQTAGDQWHESAILNRATELFDVARAIWPRPMVATSTLE